MIEHGLIILCFGVLGFAFSQYFRWRDVSRQFREAQKEYQEKLANEEKAFSAFRHRFCIIATKMGLFADGDDVHWAAPFNPGATILFGAPDIARAIESCKEACNDDDKKQHDSPRQAGANTDSPGQDAASFY